MIGLYNQRVRKCGRKWEERGGTYLEVVIKVLQISLVWRDLVTACLLFFCL